eukprot:CAMPEP_0201482650 /NCGR_PEP_ID=MMETSP0151_2-20130828/6915_1 /ASSEMBLY_ACC=CAM_ASM_000257 /TAXON_ID=200890 /ORGANISM="Paramoeba atlantica, Strain 621/1 / CCAP 1560/9" /LENGTH=257 /DNA_ID=CAMNT_0047865433 /DNA_START=41 /DNA_END=814 /DNA_ORIENTATION=-
MAEEYSQVHDGGDHHRLYENERGSSEVGSGRDEYYERDDETRRERERKGERGREGESAESRGGGDDSICTLFVSGLPDDVLLREIHNLFRWFPGYEDSVIKHPQGKGICAFCKFTTHSQAQVALNKLQGSVFDPDFSRPLFIEFAKTNSRKRRRESGPVEFWHPENLQKRLKHEPPRVSHPPPPREDLGRGGAYHNPSPSMRPPPLSYDADPYYGGRVPQVSVSYPEPWPPYPSSPHLSSVPRARKPVGNQPSYPPY